MIRRERSNFTLTCDGCGLVIQDRGFRSYKEAWGQAQREGWTARPTEDRKDYKHFCSGCTVRQANRVQDGTERSRAL